MSKKAELYATLRDVLQALKLQEEDVERVINEVNHLANQVQVSIGGDDDGSGSGSSPGTGRRSGSRNSKAHKTLVFKQPATPSKDRRREILLNSTLQYSSFRAKQSKEQSVPDLHVLLANKSQNRVSSRNRKRRSTHEDDQVIPEEQEKENKAVGSDVEERQKIESEKISKIAVILVQLTESEANYMNKLQILVEEFLIPMRTKVQEQTLGSPGGKGTLRTSKGPMKDFEGINAFLTVENLAQISTDFYKELMLILEKWPKYGIKSPFVMLLNVASQYKEYVSNWNTIHEMLGNTKSAMTAFLHDRAIKSQQDLLNLLSLPLTRLHQYEAVLHEILGTLPTVHADYSALRDAYQQLKNFVQELDNVRHRSENGACILRIMRRMVNFDGSLMEEGRLFIYEDQVTFVIGKKKHNGVISLFSDILLLARYAHYSNNLKYKCQVSLTHCTIFPTTELDDKNTFTFRIKVRDPDNSFNNEKEQAFLVYTSTAEAKDKWLTHLNKTVQNVEAKKVFGASLLKCKEMPPFLKKLLAYLNNSVTDMSDDEFLRVNSGTTQIQKIKQDADLGKNVEFPSPSLAASLLKLYLRELPEALLAELRCWFLELASEGQAPDGDSNKFYKMVISSLPRLQKEILTELMRFFSDLTKPKNPPNKISPRSIGITFGSNLFYGKGDVEPADLQLVSSATEYMVTHYSELFEPPS
eukprot:Phypoly_transcript_03849.p1 GENE.Phypoly_transcript_03849~~Phypoly_transcript_03849.p1  ORF type:complete len:698 (+),score=96.28 Phypoly_transcript_03849:77-2170(+)